jgi:hypothetical protein
VNVRELGSKFDLLVNDAEYSRHRAWIPDLPGTYDSHAPPIALEPISDFDEEW